MKDTLWQREYPSQDEEDWGIPRGGKGWLQIGPSFPSPSPQIAITASCPCLCSDWGKQCLRKWGKRSDWVSSYFLQRNVKSMWHAVDRLLNFNGGDQTLNSYLAIKLIGSPWAKYSPPFLLSLSAWPTSQGLCRDKRQAASVSWYQSREQHAHQYSHSHVTYLLIQNIITQCFSH